MNIFFCKSNSKGTQKNTARNKKIYYIFYQNRIYIFFQKRYLSSTQEWEKKCKEKKCNLIIFRLMLLRKKVKNTFFVYKNKNEKKCIRNVFYKTVTDKKFVLVDPLRKKCMKLKKNHEKKHKKRRANDAFPLRFFLCFFQFFVSYFFMHTAFFS